MEQSKKQAPPETPTASKSAEPEPVVAPAAPEPPAVPEPPKPPVSGDQIWFRDWDGNDHVGFISFVSVNDHAVRLVWLTNFGTWQPETGPARGEKPGTWRSRP